MKSQELTVLERLNHLLFGYKYYANIVATKGTTRVELCSYIFRTKEEADKHRSDVESTLTFRFIETVSFRSRKGYYHRPDDPVDHCIR